MVDLDSRLDISGVGWLAKSPTVVPEDMSSIPKTHMLKNRTNSFKLFSDYHTCEHTYIQ